ncbi:hypothetical protein NYP16_06905 [Alphaproteobacteria bacterium LMG 31809]|uniref:Uncharacterized protein n=1 Tax=Govanella unica TaxID=2975056 RepID=A0A9X3Z713_9PROT|nr:hypothetical protein [Govania unica]MDA5193682.1 hypothetical protein [Govania unica]
MISDRQNGAVVTDLIEAIIEDISIALNPAMGLEGKHGHTENPGGVKTISAQKFKQSERVKEAKIATLVERAQFVKNPHKEPRRLEMVAGLGLCGLASSDRLHNLLHGTMLQHPFGLARRQKEVQKIPGTCQRSGHCRIGQEIMGGGLNICINAACLLANTCEQAAFAQAMDQSESFSIGDY